MVDKMVTAVVIADNHYNGLGVIRSLGEQGVPIILILLDTGKTIIDKSRYVGKVLKIERNKEAVVEAVQTVIRDKGRYALYPLSDFAAQILDEERCCFPENVICPNANGKMSEMMNKYFLSELFRTYGVTVPMHIEYTLGEKLVWHEFPAIIKPLASVEGVKGDIATVYSEAEMIDRLKLFQEKGYKHVLIEEFISGTDEFMIEVLGYVDFLGTPHFSRVIHKVREYPIKNGSTAFAYLEKYQEYLNMDALKQAVQATGYRGIFDIEFKYGAGKAYFIEMNFRNGAPAYALTKMGFNIAYEWLSSQGREIPPQFDYVNNNKIHFMCETRDILNMIKGNVGLRSWIRDFIKSNKLIWNWRDLRPSLLSYLSVVMIPFRRLFHV